MLRIVNCWLMAAALGLSMIQPASAITIDFDDLDPEDFQGGEELRPLTNEYESQGVVFEWGAYLLEWGSTDALSLPNYVGGPGFKLHFVQDLPTYVSVYVSSMTGYQVGVSAYGPTGFVGYKVTDGELHGMASEDSTPYRPNQFVYFIASGGISSLEFSGQSDTAIDNLTFSSLPEPAPWLLLGAGLWLLRRQRVLKS